MFDVCPKCGFREPDPARMVTNAMNTFVSLKNSREEMAVFNEVLEKFTDSKGVEWARKDVFDKEKKSAKTEAIAKGAVPVTGVPVQSTTPPAVPAVPNMPIKAATQAGIEVQPPINATAPGATIKGSSAQAVPVTVTHDPNS